jgi:SAM-dependent methyltransferase
MKLPRVLMPALARQLGRPSGVVGRLVIARMLNKGNRGMVTKTVDALELGAGEVGADIGFGGGVALELLLERVGPAGRVLGVDFAPAMVSQAAARFRKEPRLTVFEGSITELPLGDASVDGISSTNTIYFVEDLDTAFAEVARVLKPGGRFALGIADPDMMRKLPFTQHGFRIRPVDEVCETLTAAGLAIKDRRKIGKEDRFFHLIVTRRD